MKALAIWLALALSFGMGVIMSAALDEAHTPKPDWWQS